MTDKVRAVADAWLRLPVHDKPDLMARHPNLYWAVSRLTADHIVNRHTSPKEKQMNREPVVTVASITAAVAALIGLLIAFGLDISDDQQKAILAVVAVVGPIVAGVISRSKVTPVSKGL